jgi:uncharacterized protein YjbI with pentapeptide repeats
MRVFKYFFLFTLFALSIGGMIYFVLFPERAPAWSGFSTRTLPPNTEGPKTLWNLLDLFLIPLILALGAWYLGNIEKQNEKEREAEKNQRDNVSKFLELMTALLLEKKLNDNQASSDVKSVARAQSLRLFRESDNSRKGIVLQFLYETALISKNPKIDLNGANLRTASLDGIVLNSAELSGAYFCDCRLKNAQLVATEFRGSDFREAQISNCNVDEANFEYADFREAKVDNCDFTKSNLDGADFRGVNLSTCRLTQEQCEIHILTDRNTKLPKK